MDTKNTSACFIPPEKTLRLGTLSPSPARIMKKKQPGGGLALQAWLGLLLPPFFRDHQQ